MFSTMIAYGVQMTMKVSDHLCDLGVKGQGQIYLEFDIRLETQNSSFTLEGVHIFHTDCL